MTQRIDLIQDELRQTFQDVDATMQGYALFMPNKKALAERLFGHQYAVEMRLPAGEGSTERVGRLPSVLAVLNGEETRLIGKRPVDGIRTQS